ncbi:MAG: shikimate dehydrogenase [Bacteroidales bacterium]|nr:shikimate dehydrogenase [Bacteroidales bacterium]
MVLYGLIGQSLSHSLSKEIFTTWFAETDLSADYRLYELEDIAGLPGLLKRYPAIRGLNVTTPFKTAVLSFCDYLDLSAEICNAVNCLTVAPGSITGYNTDREGFRKALLLWIGETIPNALIMGSGGAARAAASVVSELGASYIIVSRDPREEMIHYAQINSAVLQEFPLIINATPVGMYPDVDQMPPLPWKWVSEKNLFFDMIYNPQETMFLKWASELGAPYCNGLVMLIEQAKKSKEIWGIGT